MTEESTTFAVNDRRKFTAEGDRRLEALYSAPATAPGIQEGVPFSGECASPGVSEQRSRSAPAFPEGRVDLSSFVISQAVQAQVLIANPPAEMSRADALSGARYFISVLEMLEECTREGRTTQETSLFEGVLFDLRMAFVERTREAGS